MQKFLRYKKEIAFSIVLVFLLALIRTFEDLFYDPFLNYFKADYSNSTFPEYNSIKLFFSLLLRFALNSIVSLAIIQVLFKNFSLTKFASVLYITFFIILIITFFGILNFSPTNNFLLFYVRRFLIQPLFVLLFVPAFYYQNKIKEKA